MRQYEIQNIEKYIAAHRKKRRWLRAMTCLAAVVVFATTYAMMLPALTREIVCPLPEHVHAEECYTRIEDPDSGETVQVLTCGMEEHTHTEECFADAEDPPASQPEETPFAAERASGSLEVSLLYEDESTQEAHPDGWTYWTHEPMEGYLRLEPANLDTDLTDVTVTLSMPKEYVEKDSIQIPEFSTNSEITRYEIPAGGGGRGELPHLHPLYGLRQDPDPGAALPSQLPGRRGPGQLCAAGDGGGFRRKRHGAQSV